LQPLAGKQPVHVIKKIIDVLHRQLEILEPELKRQVRVLVKLRRVSVVADDRQVVSLIVDIQGRQVLKRLLRHREVLPIGVGPNRAVFQGIGCCQS